jgi:hypothetical protein
VSVCCARQVIQHTIHLASGLACHILYTKAKFTAITMTGALVNTYTINLCNVCVLKQSEFLNIT